MTTFCPDCGAMLRGHETCETHFHQMLFWESEFPDLGVVHHLMVLCYYLQHPRLYSPEGLNNALGLLVAFVERGASPAEVRESNGKIVDSGKRDWKVTARPDSFGVYAYPVQWPMTAADVTARGAEQYIDSVREWAAAALQALQKSENLPR
jgi:hypothetical protein